MADWNTIYKEQGKFFTGTQEDIKDLIKLMKRKGVKKILDLGCGTGRHVIEFAKEGFEVYGMDISEEGLKITKKELDKNKLNANLIKASCYDKFEFPDKFFDAIVSVQVIFHNYHEKVKYCISEIYRVLKPGGIAFITVTLGKGKHFEKRKIIDTNTFIPLSGLEEGVVHFVYTKEILEEDFNRFKILNIHIDNKEHYCILLEKK